jgi:hypothetical protein
MYLEANTKSNEIGGFDGKCCRCLVISRALGPDNDCPSFTIPSHEYIRLILGNVYLFSGRRFFCKTSKIIITLYMAQSLFIL